MNASSLDPIETQVTEPFVPGPEMFRYGQRRGSPVARAWSDLCETGRLWRLGMMLGWLDIRLRYRGSVLGPLWLTVTSALMVATMGTLYGHLFHQDLSVYLPFLSVSLALWQTGLSSLVQEACTSFIEAETTIRSTRLPLTLHAVRVVGRNMIVLGHNIVVPLGVFALYGVWPGAGALLAIPGLILWVLNGFSACLVLGTLCARFRDIPPIVAAGMQIVFYVTPVIWQPRQLPRGKAVYLLLNPFYALLETVREPLLGHPVSGAVWGVAGGVTVCLGALAAVVFVRTRARLVFWI